MVLGWRQQQGDGATRAGIRSFFGRDRCGNFTRVIRDEKHVLSLPAVINNNTRLHSVPIIIRMGNTNTNTNTSMCMYNRILVHSQVPWLKFSNLYNIHG